MEKVAQTILNQLGGNKFLSMTGAQKITFYDNALGFKIGRNKSKANWIKIIYEYGQDLYNIEFYSFTMKNGLSKIKTIEQVYCDKLQEVFTDETGLLTRL